MTVTHYAPLRCGIVLAGGEGKRLQHFIHQLLGYNLPKQYANLTRARSMLEQTIDRARQLMPSERIFTVVARDHLDYADARRQLKDLPMGTVVIQPLNKETGPGLLLPLLHLLLHYPNSTVAVFPSDHFILPEDLFLSHVQVAFEAVEKNPTQIAILGVEPKDPDPEYGYIVPKFGSSRISVPFIGKVEAFIEKPRAQTAAEIISLGALWNTMVMVFKPEILLHLVSIAAPNLYQSFQQIFKVIATSEESLAIEQIYADMQPVSFSKDLLEPIAFFARNQISVIPMKEILWSDCGTEERILAVLQAAKPFDYIHKTIPKSIPGLVPVCDDVSMQALI